MSKLADIVNAPGFELEVKQFECVLDFVTAVEQAMEARQITQSALARALGKSRAWVSKVLRKKPNLTFFTAVEIADALGKDVRIQVMNRAGNDVIAFERASEIRMAAESAEVGGWDPGEVQMRPIAEATVIPFPRAA